MAKLYRLSSTLTCKERIEIFTNQHKKIGEICKRHMEMHENGNGNYLTVIKELIDYMSLTFHEENVIMMNASYPDFLAHAKDHQRFTEKIEEFLQSYKNGDQDLGFKIFVFLKDWMRDHNSKLDMEFADYLRKNAAENNENGTDESPFTNVMFAFSPGR